MSYMASARKVRTAFLLSQRTVPFGRVKSYHKASACPNRLKWRLIDIRPSSVREFAKRDQIVSQVVNDVTLSRNNKEGRLKALTVD